MLGQVGGHRVRHGHDALLSAHFMFEHLEVAVEELIGFTDSQLKPEPISRGANLRRLNTALLEEGAHSICRILRWGNERFDLFSPD